MSPDEVSRFARALEGLTLKVSELSAGIAGVIQWQDDRPCQDHAGRIRDLEAMAVRAAGVEETREARRDAQLAAARTEMHDELTANSDELRQEISAVRGKVDKTWDRVRLLTWLAPLGAILGASIPEGAPRVWAFIVKVATAGG